MTWPLTTTQNFFVPNFTLNAWINVIDVETIRDRSCGFGCMDEIWNVVILIPTKILPTDDGIPFLCDFSFIVKITN